MLKLECDHSIEEAQDIVEGMLPFALPLRAKEGNAVMCWRCLQYRAVVKV